MKLECCALLICEQAFPQAETGVWHVIGVHDRVFLRTLPATVDSFVVYWRLHGFAGDGMVMTTIRDNVGSVVHAVRAMIPRRPAQALEQAFVFPPFAFKTAGSHALELHVADQLLALRSFHVHLLPS